MPTLLKKSLITRNIRVKTVPVDVWCHSSFLLHDPICLVYKNLSTEAGIVSVSSCPTVSHSCPTHGAPWDTWKDRDFWGVLCSGSDNPPGKICKNSAWLQLHSGGYTM